MKTILLILSFSLTTLLFSGCVSSKEETEPTVCSVTVDVRKINNGDGEVAVDDLAVSGVFVKSVSSGGEVFISVEIERGNKFSLDAGGSIIRKNESYTYHLQNIYSDKKIYIVIDREEFEMNLYATKGGSIHLSQPAPFYYGQTPTLQVETVSPDSVISSIEIDGIIESGVAGTKSFSKILSILDDIDANAVFMMTEAEILSRVTSWKIESSIDYSPDGSVVISNHGGLNPYPGDTKTFYPSYLYKDISSRGTVNGHWKVDKVGGKVFLSFDVAATWEIISATHQRVVLKRMTECVGVCTYPEWLTVETIVPSN